MTTTSDRWYAVASLIDHQRRHAHGLLRGARQGTWELHQPRVYVRTYSRADIAGYLADAARERRALAVLLRYQARGVAYLTAGHWEQVRWDTTTPRGTREALHRAATEPAPRPPWLAAALDQPTQPVTAAKPADRLPPPARPDTATGLPASPRQHR